MKNEQGFTCVELLVVLLILSLLFCILLPSFGQSWQQISMDAAILQLHRDLRWAQQLAAREQKTVSVTFFQARQPYRYVVRVSGQSKNQRRRELPDSLRRIEAQTILIRADKRFQKNGHILLVKGTEERYVYYYQTGRSRITRQKAV